MSKTIRSSKSMHTLRRLKSRASTMFRHDEQHDEDDLTLMAPIDFATTRPGTPQHHHHRHHHSSTHSVSTTSSSTILSPETLSTSSWELNEPKNVDYHYSHHHHHTLRHSKRPSGAWTSWSSTASSDSAASSTLSSDLFVVSFHRKSNKDDVERAKQLIIDQGGCVREITILPFQIKASMQNPLVQQLSQLKSVKRLERV